MPQASHDAAPPRRKVVVNLGSGPKRISRLPPVFAEWREFRVDIDPAAAPDLVADISDLSSINSGSADAVGDTLHRASLLARGDEGARRGPAHPGR
jgi:hypothetical protein